MNPVTLLKDLIALPSVNPMGRALDGPEFYEERVSDYLERFFRDLGVVHERIELAPRRANVIARLDGEPGAPTVLLDAHQDTVPVDGMTIAPFDPVERDGKIFGRGACDVKGGLAAMLSAFARLATERPAGRASVVMSCTCDEESTSLGINDLVTMWRDPKRTSTVLRARPDAAIVAEPTSLDVVVAHRGASRWKIHTTGRACHSSRPWDGVNAIYRMAKVLECLEEFATRLPEMVPAHPLCGPATFSVGRIEGGVSVNTVPDDCAIEVDRRVIPGENGWQVIDDLAKYLRDRLDFEVRFDPPWIVGESLSDEHNGRLAARLLEFVEQVAGPHARIGVPYGTHASRTAAAGIPSVVFGPGSIAQAHTSDEWISVPDLEQAAEVYYLFCAAGNGG